MVAELLVNAAVTTAAAMFLIAMASSFAWLLAWAGFGTSVLEVLAQFRQYHCTFADRHFHLDPWPFY